MNAAQFDGGSHQGWSSSSVGSRCECACVLGGVGAGWRGAAEPHSPLYTLCSLAQVLTIRSPASLQAAGWLLARSGEASLGGGGVSPPLPHLLADRCTNLLPSAPGEFLSPVSSACREEGVGKAMLLDACKSLLKIPSHPLAV